MTMRSGACWSHLAPDVALPHEGRALALQEVHGAHALLFRFGLRLRNGAPSGAIGPADDNAFFRSRA